MSELLPQSSGLIVKREHFRLAASSIYCDVNWSKYDGRSRRNLKSWAAYLLHSLQVPIPPHIAEGSEGLDDNETAAYHSARATLVDSSTSWSIVAGSARQARILQHNIPTKVSETDYLSRFYQELATQRAVHMERFAEGALRAFVDSTFLPHAVEIVLTKYDEAQVL